MIAGTPPGAAGADLPCKYPAAPRIYLTMCDKELMRAA
jgi:hypothetical protein